ncbi:MAG: hypothetical protein MUD01_09730 [Chloroflexaceae bacterium]|nr:hypothetical protein [Chloroflexaceae bacterium]
MTSVVLAIVGAVMLVALLGVLWRFWQHYAARDQSDEEYEGRVARLNDRQANRVSDERITQNITPDEAWDLMVRRGMERRRRDRAERPPRRRK